MRTPVLAAFFLFIFSIGFSQKPNTAKAFTFKIEGTIQNFKGNKIYVHHKWDEKDYTDSTTVKNGKFTFNLKSTEPNMYWFTTGPNAAEQPNYPFFADNAPIKAYLKGDSIAYSNVEGGQTQKDYMDYRVFINSLVMIQQKMQADYNVAIQNGDVNAQNAIRNEYQNLNGQYLSGLKNFIKNHPKSAVSGYIIYTDMGNASIQLPDVVEALSYIDKSIENTKFIQLANKRVNDLKGTTVGYTATNFSQNTPDGKKVNLTDFRGKYVLIDFWASWCRPCRMENPNVVAAYNRYKDKGFTVLGVSMDSNKDPWVAAIQQDNLTWTHVSDLKGWGNEVGKLYHVTGIPQNYLLDKDGKIIAKDLRGAALDEKLAEIIK
jgi:peroxiredoxin